MVSVTMSANPPPTPSAETGIVIFPVGAGHPRMLEQIDAYYETHFRQRQMESFAQFVLEKGHGAYSPRLVKNERGEMVRETWQACGRRLFGQRFVAIMERAVNEYRAAAHIASEHAADKPPPSVLDEIPDPEF